MAATTRRAIGFVAGLATVGLLIAGPADAGIFSHHRGGLDTKPGCFGAGNQGRTRDHLQRAHALRILSVHQDVTGIIVLDNKANTIFKGMPHVGQVIKLPGVRFAYLQATTKGANGCLVKYAPQ